MSEPRVRMFMAFASALAIAMATGLLEADEGPTSSQADRLVSELSSETWTDAFDPPGEGHESPLAAWLTRSNRWESEGHFAEAKTQTAHTHACSVGRSHRATRAGNAAHMA